MATSPALPPTLLAPGTHRRAVGGLFFVQGLCFSSWASRIPAVQQRMGLSDRDLGLVLFAIPIGLMLSLPLAGWLVARYGSRRVVLGGNVFFGTTLLLLGAAQNQAQLIGAMLLFGLASNLANISVNTQAVGVEALYGGRSIMASFHGLWSLAGFTGAAIGSVMIGWGVAPLPHFGLSVALMLGLLLLCRPYILPRDAPRPADQPIFVLPDRSLLLLGLLAFCSMICEGAMFDWSGVYFKKVVLAEEAWISAGFVAFMSTMAGGRFVSDWFVGRFGRRRTLQLSGLLTAGGLLLAVLLPQLPTAVAGCLLVGAGVSSVVPLVYGAAGRSTTMSAGVALAAVSTVGFLGILLGPVLIGLVAGATSLRVSFTIIALMGLCITGLAGSIKS